MQARKGLLAFCEDNDLVHANVALELVNEEWVSEAWSCDEDGVNSQEWRDRLAAVQPCQLTDAERLDENLDVWEIKRLIYDQFWHRLKKWRAERPRQQSKPEKKHFNLGRTSDRMPTNIPFGFMVDKEWKRNELPKWDEAYWKRESTWPPSLGERADQI
ncbi:hypothetical protein DACRYDRAFT_21524, partial [Dacryopinax primogenitus]